MVMAGHHHKRQKPISLIREVEERVLDNRSLPIVFQMTYRRIAIQQFIDKSEKQFLFVVFPIRRCHVIRVWTRLEFFAECVNARQPRR